MVDLFVLVFPWCALDSSLGTIPRWKEGVGRSKLGEDAVREEWVVCWPRL